MIAEQNLAQATYTSVIFLPNVVTYWITLDVFSSICLFVCGFLCLSSQ